jgi:hypothetical protein
VTYHLGSTVILGFRFGIRWQNVRTDFRRCPWFRCCLFYFILCYVLGALGSLYLIIGCPLNTILFCILYYFYFRKTLIFFIIIYGDRWMACVFFSLTCTRVFVYTWRLSPLSTILFGSRCDKVEVVNKSRYYSRISLSHSHVISRGEWCSHWTSTCCITPRRIFVMSSNIILLFLK